MKLSIKLTDSEKEQIVEAGLENYIKSNGYKHFNHLIKCDIMDIFDESMLNIVRDCASYRPDAETRKLIITEIFNKINNFCEETLKNNAHLMQQLLS